MKELKRIPMLVLYARYYLLKLKEYISSPLADMPRPDFNNLYDATIL